MINFYNNLYKFAPEKLLIRENGVVCFHCRGVFCLMSTIAHFIEEIRYHHGGNRDINQSYSQSAENKHEDFHK